MKKQKTSITGNEYYNLAKLLIRCHGTRKKRDARTYLRMGAYFARPVIRHVQKIIVTILSRTPSNNNIVIFTNENYKKTQIYSIQTSYTTTIYAGESFSAATPRVRRRRRRFYIYNVYYYYERCGQQRHYYLIDSVGYKN